MATLTEALNSLRVVDTVASNPTVDPARMARINQESLLREENRIKILPLVENDLIPGLKEFNRAYLWDSASMDLETYPNVAVGMLWGVREEYWPGDLVNPNSSSDHIPERHEVGNMFRVLIDCLSGSASLNMGKSPHDYSAEISDNILEDPEWQKTLARLLVHFQRLSEPQGLVASYSLGPTFRYSINKSNPSKNRRSVAIL